MKLDDDKDQNTTDRHIYNNAVYVKQFHSSYKSMQLLSIALMIEQTIYK